MRTFLSGVLTIVAMAAIVLALPSVWMQLRLVDSAGFDATVAPMARNAQVQDYLATEITTQGAQATGVGISAGLVRPVAQAYTRSDQFPTDFADIVSQQHAWLFNEPAPGTNTSVMQLDITSMVNRVIAQQKLINVTVPGPILVPLANGSNGLEAGRYHQVGQQITRIAYASVVIAVIAGLLALIIARRRGTVLAMLGLGAVASAAFAWAVALYFSDRAHTEVDAAGHAAGDATNVVINALRDDLQHVALIAGAIGAGVIVVGVVWRMLAGSSSR